MKLIDLLVKYLGNNGGWPIGAEICAQDNDCEVVFYSAQGIHRSVNNLVWTIPVGIESKVFKRRIFIALAEDSQTAIVSRSEYESALAASQQPSWSGEGLPPVGCKFEYGSHRTAATCLGVGLDMVFAWKGDPLQGTYEEFMISIRDSCFRPIRTEADRKRDKAIQFMSSVFRDHVDNKKTNGQESVFHAIYDAFKAGKFE